jgi:membrane-associated phospholipid phosphatase
MSGDPSRSSIRGSAVGACGRSDARQQAQTRSWNHNGYAGLEWGIAALLRPPRGKPIPGHTGRRLFGAAVLTSAAVIAAMVLFDGELAAAVRRVPAWIHVGFRELSDYGKSGWFLWPTGLVLLAIALAASQPMSAFGRLVLAALAVRVAFLFTAVALPSLTVAIVKRVIGRARPFVGGHLDPFLYGLPVWRPDYASMPSGHATSAFATAFAVALLWPSLRIPMLIYAFLIAASRMVLDAHYLSDVIAGAAVGAAGALLVRDWFAARRLGFIVGPDGTVSRLPGPSFARLKRIGRSLLAR